MQMKNCYSKLVGLIVTLIFTGIPFYATASDFSVPFVNAADLGTMYSGWAAEANDASTAFTNPAGLVRITQQQLVFAAVGITGNTQYSGTVSGNYPAPTTSDTGTASSKIGAVLPSFYYAFPLSDKVVLGFSETVPFGLGTNYAKDSVVRYAGTKTQIAVIDFGPDVGFKITDKLSGGLGLDVDHVALNLNYMVKMGGSNPDAETQNSLSGWGYGYHAGLLYQFTPATRLGLNYNSPVNFHASGDSTLYSSLIANGEFKSNDLKANLKLLQMTQLSLYQDINPRWAVMGSVFYTDWHVLQQVTLQNVAIPPGSTINTTMPFNYESTFDYAVGTTFKVNPQWTLRTGVMLITTASNSENRLIGDPVGDQTVVGIGAHYQQNHSIGYDIGYAHDFFKQVTYNNASAISTETGHSDTQTNVFGAQLTWNIG